MGDLFDNPFNPAPSVVQSAAEIAAGIDPASVARAPYTFTHMNPAPVHALDPSQLQSIGVDPITGGIVNFDAAPPLDWKKILMWGGGIALLLFGLSQLHRR